jgi:uncharacterized cupredoxin-like copper-binding protein
MIGCSTGSRPERWRIAVVALAAVLALSTVLSLAHSSRSAPPPVGLILKEFLFDPKDVTVAGTGEIVFVVKNQGAIEHNLVLEVPGGKSVTPVAIIEPGQTTRVTVSLPAGFYTIYCSLPGHREAGMAATLRVSGATTGGTTSGTAGGTTGGTTSGTTGATTGGTNP